jgi:hypothetical protein
MRTGFGRAEFAKRLERVGLDRKQAEEYIAVLRDIAADNLVTKRDLSRLDDCLVGQEQRMPMKVGMVIIGPAEPLRVLGEQ